MNENSDYTKEIFFNMGMEFYNLLANIKKMVIVYYCQEQYEKVIYFLEEEKLHIEPFIKPKDDKDKRLEEVDYHLKKLNSYIMQNHIFRKHYLKLKSLLNSLEADNGMLQPFNLKMNSNIPFTVRN